MATTYTLISSNVLSSSASSVTFSSIPGTYTDLVLRISARTGRTDPDPMRITFNSDSPTSGTTYSDTYLNGTSTVATSGRNSSTSTVFNVRAPGVNYTANTFSSNEVYIPNYTVSANKPFSSFSAVENNDATVWDIYGGANLYRNTAAITSITLTPVSSFVSGSSFYLYGIKSS
jgi:hypothetical protein